MHLFFDLDNTLWDFRKNSKITIQEMYEFHSLEEIYNVSFDKFYPVYHNKNEELWIEFRDHNLTKEELRARRFKESFETVGIFNETLALTFEDNYLDQVIHHHHLVDFAEETLTYLQQKGYFIHVISNGFVEVTHRKVEKSKLKPFIQTITSAEEINKRKPNPELFFYALKKANASAINSVLIGDDWIADIEGAKNSSIRPIFFNSSRENFDFTNVEVIYCLSELKNIF